MYVTNCQQVTIVNNGHYLASNLSKITPTIGNEKDFHFCVKRIRYLTATLFSMGNIFFSATCPFLVKSIINERCLR